MKKIKKPEDLEEVYESTNMPHAVRELQALVIALIDNQNELVEWHNSCELIELRTDEHEKAKEQPGHWECPAGWIPDVPEAPGHWECPAHGAPENYMEEDDGFVYCKEGPLPRCNERLTWRPDKEPEQPEEPEGYYWCLRCRKVVDVDDGRHSCEVTGPHIDICPECSEPMEARYFALPTGWRMGCATSKAHFKGPAKPTEAEAIHAWRKVMHR